MDILALLQCLQPAVSRTTLRQFSRIVVALLVMTGRVTMLGISRWAGQGGSYRTVQRFFSQALPWAMLFWVFFRQHIYRSDEVYLLVGDEVVATKAGKHTHGLDRFFASLYGKPVPGLAFFMFSLVSTSNGARSRSASSRSCAATQRKRPARPKRTAKKQAPPPPQRRPGRPKGSKNTPKAE